MSDKRSRRRFLADLLFLGGGLTAASLVTGTVLRESSSTGVEPEIVTKPSTPPPSTSSDPVAAGEMEIPDSDFGDPKPECENTPERPQLTERDPFSKGGDEPPAFTGAVVAPSKPSVAGRRALPRGE